MSAAQKLPVAYEEVPSEPRAPVITLIGSDLPAAYLDDAEPSPLMESASRLWRRITNSIKLAIVVLLVGGYPAAMVMSHQVDASPIVLSNMEPWASPEVGVALNILGRELTGPGWARDKPGWHPQSRLTALPAWQEGLITALSEHTLLSASIASGVDGSPDPDLIAAGRLLAPEANVEAVPRLNAAAQALQRYDGRLSRGLASAPAGIDSLQAELTLFTGWAEAAEARLRRSANSAEAWPASRADIETIYLARAHAHAANQLLTASLAREPDLIINRDAAEARDKALAAWKRAARFNPVFISSQTGTNRFLSDHPATMAFYMAEAASTTKALQDKLTVRSELPISVAAAQ